MPKNEIRVVIAEDDYYTIDHLKTIIDKHDDIKVVGEAHTGKELITVVKDLKPDAIFVDIEMPQLNGMSATKILLEEMDEQNLFVVFITGHIGFAIEAFEICSTDYVLKPFDEERINKSIQRIRDNYTKIQQEVTTISQFIKTPEKLYVKCGYELHFIDCSKIYCIEKIDKKTRIFTKDKVYETNDALSALEERLNPNLFIRSHKSFLINLSLVEKIIPWGDRCYQVSFQKTETTALITRAKLDIFYKLLNVSTV